MIDKRSFGIEQYKYLTKNNLKCKIFRFEVNKFDEQTSLKTVLRYFAKVPFFRTRFVVFPIENQANGLTYLTHPQMRNPK